MAQQLSDEDIERIVDATQRRRKRIGPRKPKPLPKFLGADEPEALIGATTRQRDRLMLFCMRYLGLRVSEVTKLRIEHMDFRRKTALIFEAKGKKDRSLSIPKELVGPLRGWCGAKREGLVFPSPRGGQLTSRAVQLLMKRLAVKAGLRSPMEPRRVTPHKLRHAFCSDKIARGVDLATVRDLMGHSSIAVTNTYAHATPERLREAMEI